MFSPTTLSTAVVGVISNNFYLGSMITNKTYFFTATILNWLPVLVYDETKNIILNSFRFLVKKGSLQIFAFVIMPNHIHLIWRPLSKNVQLSFMKFTAQQIKFWLQVNRPITLEKLQVNKKDRQYQIWQRNPLAIELYSKKVFEQKFDYIHNNPCQGRWLLANDPTKYKFSSAAYYEGENVEFDFLTHYLEEM